LASDRRIIGEMLNMSKVRRGSQVLAPEEISELTKNDVTTTRSYENDEITNRWPLTKSSPPYNDERSVTLGWGGGRKRRYI
jgi:hypothetical protein